MDRGASEGGMSTVARLTQPNAAACRQIAARYLDALLDGAAELDGIDADCCIELARIADSARIALIRLAGALRTENTPPTAA
jgi:hypothetical protein